MNMVNNVSNQIRFSPIITSNNEHVDSHFSRFIRTMKKQTLMFKFTFVKQKTKVNIYFSHLSCIMTVKSCYWFSFMVFHCEVLIEMHF